MPNVLIERKTAWTTFPTSNVSPLARMKLAGTECGEAAETLHLALAGLPQARDSQMPTLRVHPRHMR